MFPLFETIRIREGVPQHLEWHQKRLDRSFHLFFKMKRAPVLAEVIRVPEEYRRGTVKCRFFYNRGAYESDFSQYTPLSVNLLKAVKCDYIDYSMKFTDRFILEQLLEKREDCDDILIIKQSEITDTSYSNIAFYDGREWLTPANPLLEGTCRSRLLYQNKIREKVITLKDLQGFNSFRLINAMLDFDQQDPRPVSNIIH
ncbi:MAG: aminotransferase class IV family protein [Bacteroidales bacterium]|nr:aminotransferase class IV family protein [Bacteroidales bacterium]